MKTSWRHLWKTSLKMSWRCFSKTSWRRLENVLARRLEDILKTFSKRLEDVLKACGQDENIGLDQDVLKTSSEDKGERRLQEVIIKTNVCWEVITKKSLSLKAQNYSLRCNSKMSPRKSERSQRRFQGDVFNQCPRRRLRALQIKPFWDVSLSRSTTSCFYWSETLYKTSQRCIWDASMPTGNSFREIIPYRWIENLVC